jgi:hypothetical protein
METAKRREKGIIGSRPHTPVTEQEPYEMKEDRELNIRIAGFEEGYAQGKSEAARTATLAELVELLDISKGVWNLPDMQDRIRNRIKSLRQSTTAAQEPHP